MSMSLLSIKLQSFPPPVGKSGRHFFSWAVGTGRACRGLGVTLWVLVLSGTDRGLASLWASPSGDSRRWIRFLPQCPV